MISQPSQAETVRVAVASNFALTLSRVIDQFSTVSTHNIVLSAASSGKHFAQISHGAPFDVFLSADADRPAKLVDLGLVTVGAVKPYAVGELVLWAGNQSIKPLSAAALSREDVERIAIASPSVSPYGLAAMQVFEALGLTTQVAKKFVRGENIGQTFQYVATGNADLGLLARSQVIEYASSGSVNMEPHYWRIPKHLYAAIRQDAVLLSKSAAAAEFFMFLQSPEAQKIIRESGYTTPRPLELD